MTDQGMIVCERCDETAPWGVTLYDDGAGLERYGFVEGIVLCDGCREKFEDWMEAAA